MPLLLAIETSQRSGSVALRDLEDDGEIAVERLSPRLRHDDDLMPAIDRLLRRGGRSPQDLRRGAVGVSIGPGGFTGLRIAISTAKMLAETLAVRLVAVPSALVAAQATEIGGQRSEVRGQESMIIALASKNDTAWCTRIQRAGSAVDDWSVIGQPGLCTAATLDLSGVQALLGDEHLPPAMRDLAAGRGLAVIEPAFEAAACARVAARMLRAGHTIDPLLLLPLYPRQPEAVTLWEKRLSAEQSDAPRRLGEREG